MKDHVTKVAFDRAILSTINNLYALAIESADVISVRIEYSSSMKMLNVVIFSNNTTEHAHNIILLDDEQALMDLLLVEDKLIDRIAQRRDELEEEVAV
ncbi:hypothetical protein ACGRPS_21590 [Vibrio furnissii]|uniref:hypothetical protein n=1 Tax=Vibrio furnissii TaxID=29494 RepID=UPI003748E330